MASWRLRCSDDYSDDGYSTLNLACIYLLARLGQTQRKPLFFFSAVDNRPSRFLHINFKKLLKEPCIAVAIVR